MGMHDEIHEAVRRGTLSQARVHHPPEEVEVRLPPLELEEINQLARDAIGGRRGLTILEEAAHLTGGPRREAYDHPLHDFSRSVGAFNALFSEYLKKPLLPEHWGIIQILTKLSREVHCPKRDNLVDTAGYAECISLIHKEKEKGEKGGVG